MSLDCTIRGSTLLTGDPARPVIPNSVIATKGSRIAFVGALAEAPPHFDSEVVLELPGRVITPGFVNVHTHAVLSLMRGIALDLGFAPAYTRGVPHGHDIGRDDAIALARLGALEALTLGSTTMADSYVHAEATLPAMAEIGLRVWSCSRFHDVDFTRVHEGIWRHDPNIAEACISETWRLMRDYHGTCKGRIHVMLAPHAPDTCSDWLLRKVAELALETGLPVWTHLSQSKTENEIVARRSGCTPTELLGRAGLLTERLIAAHAIHLADSDIARIAAAGTTVAHVPKGNAIGGYIAPTVQLRQAGARLALATDNLTQDMTEAMRWALAMGRVQIGGIGSEWQPKDVFVMATQAGATALGVGHELGCLRSGYLADFVIFDFRRPHLTPLLDPLGTLVHDASGRDVEHVFVDGRHVIADGEPTTVDARRIRAEAQAVAERLWARAALAA